MVQSRKWRRGGALLLIGCCLLVLAGCGGGRGSSGPVTADAAKVETGTTLQAGDWEVSLLKPPEKIKIVGSGDITYQADGDFLVVFAKVANGGQAMQLVGRDLFTVRDGQGQEYEPVKSAVQIAYVLEHGMEAQSHADPRRRAGHGCRRGSHLRLRAGRHAPRPQ